MIGNNNRLEPYVRIISALAKKKTGMTREELIKATHLADSGNLTIRLEEPESCGFVRKYRQYGIADGSYACDIQNVITADDLFS